MRRGILSSLPDDDYLSIALLHCTFNVYATICRATDRQGFLTMRDSCSLTLNDKVSTEFVGLGSGFVLLGCPWALVHFVGSFR
jgi:hypothetical protein